MLWAMERGTALMPYEKNYGYLSDEHAGYIKGLIKKAADQDKNCEVFGAGSHRYRLNETVSLNWVREFEKQYRVTLPEEYVFFITKVGNGGAGPYYGIAPLGLDKNHEKWYQNLSKPSIYDDGYLQFYKECSAFFKNGRRDEEALSGKKESELNAKFDAFCDRIRDGVLNISTQGCTYDTLLVANGSRTGEIVYMDWNLELEYPPVLINRTFLEWYQGFFEELLAGYDLRGYGYRLPGDENELMEQYEGADSGTKRSILAAFFKFKSVNEKTLSFLSRFDGVDDAHRLRLLLRFDVKKGLYFFERFLNGSPGQMEAAINACSGIPDAYREPYYGKMLQFIYGEAGDGLKRAAFLFIKSIGRLSAGDLFAFLQNKENSEEIRKTCVYVIGAAKDKKEFVGSFGDVLNSADSEGILLETLVTLRNVKSGKIAHAYKKLIPEYRDSKNFMIVKNMEAYLKNMG